MAALKYSRQREAIKSFLETRTDHPSADTVYQNIRQIYPHISLGTVYRNLSLLADIGEIKKMPGIEGADRFDGRTDRHCHFVCTCCNRIVDLEDTDIEGFIESTGRNFDGRITDCTASFLGICKDCIDQSSVNQEMTEN